MIFLSTVMDEEETNTARDYDLWQWNTIGLEA